MPKTFGTFIAGLSESLLRLFSPPQCMFCGKYLDYSDGSAQCTRCAETVTGIDGRVCRICGRELDFPKGDPVCSSCRSIKTYFIRNTAPYCYDKTVRNTIIAMKFRRNGQWLAAGFGKRLAEHISQEYGDISFDCVIPVPISFLRELKRGYNQSVVIASEAAKQLGLTVYADGLIKTKHNQKQSLLNAEERRKNVKACYAVGKHCLTDKTVLLIDDVLTTGATLNECASVVKKAGALAVYCATAAVAGKPKG